MKKVSLKIKLTLLYTIFILVVVGTVLGILFSLSGREILASTKMSLERRVEESLEEIERYIKEENSLECMKDHLAMRIKQEEASIQYHQQAIARMQLAERDMDQAEKYEGKYTFKNLFVFFNDC